MTARYRTIAVALAVCTLAACGGGGGVANGGGGGGGGPPSTTFTVGGTVAGLTGSGLVLQNNGGNDLAITTAGAFTFTTALASGAAYAVTIKTQPSGGASQSCTVANGSGTATANVTTVTVTCNAQVAKFLYVPNLTSSNVSAFAINAVTGALTEVPGSPFLAGTHPALLSADRAGKFLFVSNRGSAGTPPTESVYSINGTNGVLTQVVNSPFDLDTPPLPNGAQLIDAPLIHPSGAFGYVGVFYPTSGVLSGATVDSTTGNLLQIPGTPVNVGAGIGPGTFNAAGTVLYVPHNTLNGTPNTGAISAYTISVPSGVLTSLGSFATGGSSPTVAVLSPSGKFLLTPNVTNPSSVAVFSVDLASGTLTPAAGSPFVTGGSATTSLTVHPSKNFVYATNSNGSAASSIAAFQIDATTGVLTPVTGSPFPTDGTSALLGSVDPTGKFFYVANFGSDTIQAYTIDQTTGALTTVTGSPFITGDAPGAVKIDPSGKYLYCANSGPTANTVSAYSINTTTGALTLVNVVGAGQGPSFVELVGLQ